MISTLSTDARFVTMKVSLRVDHGETPRVAPCACLYTIDSWRADVASRADASQHPQHPHHPYPIRVMLRPRLKAHAEASPNLPLWGDRHPTFLIGVCRTH
jgi:hypothetical protein